MNWIIWTIIIIAIFVILYFIVFYLIPFKQKTKLPFRGKRKKIICFHRGGNINYPENSLESFQLAERFSKEIYGKGLIPMIKTEIRTSHDDYLICYGHKTLRPMTEEYNDSINNLSLLQIENIKLSEDNGSKLGSIPTLNDLLKYTPNLWYMLEIIDERDQGIEIARKVIDLLRKNKSESKTIIYSNSPRVNDYLERIKSKRIIHANLCRNKIINYSFAAFRIFRFKNKHELIFENNTRPFIWQLKTFINQGKSVALLETKNKPFDISSIKSMLRNDLTIISSYKPQRILNLISKRQRAKNKRKKWKEHFKGYFVKK